MKSVSIFSLTMAVVTSVLLTSGAAQAACVTTTLSASQTISGTLAATDCADYNINGNIYYYDYFVFSATTGQQLSLSVSSNQFDPDLLLIAPSGAMVYDDDGGGGTSARVTASLSQTGTFQVMVSSSIPLQTGSYTFTFALSGGGAGVSTPTAMAVEYFHAAFNHYFMTAYPEEATAIDSGSVQGWKRTGQTYTVYSQSATGLSPVCRFFSTTFAPRSSHFYTPTAPECAAVKNNPNWQFEGNAFYASESSGGNCSSGAVPLYRVYNAGRSGAPNHRYTTCSAIRDKMLARGWVSEGIAMCVPAGSADCGVDASGGGTNYLEAGGAGNYGVLTGNSADQAKFIAARGYPHLFSLGFVSETLDGSGRVVALSPPKRIESWAYNDGSFVSALFENGYFMEQRTIGSHISLQSTNLRPEQFSPGMNESQVMALMGSPSCVDTQTYAGRALRYLRYRATDESPVATVTLENGKLVALTAGWALLDAAESGTDICIGGNRILGSGR